MLSLLLGASVAFVPSWTIGLFAGIGLGLLIWLLRDQLCNLTGSWQLDRSAWLYALVALLSIAGTNLMRLDLFPDLEYGAVELLGNLILLLAAYPFWSYFRNRDRPIPFVPTVALMYGLYFGLPAVLAIKPYGILGEASDASRLMAAELTLIGLVCLVVSAYAWSYRIWRSDFPRFSAEWSQARVIPLVCLISVIALPARIYFLFNLAEESVQAIVFLIGELLALSCGMLFLLHLRGQLSRSGQVLLWCVLIPSIIIVDLASGFVTPTVRFGILLFFIYVAAKRRLPWGTLIGVLFLIFALLGAKDVFRAATWTDRSGGVEEEILQKGIVFLDLAMTFWSIADEEHLQAALERVVQRINYLSLFAHTVDLTPHTVPYWEGSSYAPLLSRIIPRLLYPDKPRESFGQDFGHEYSLLSSDDLDTSINLAQLPEMYANFGVVGVVIGMCLLGLLWGALENTFNHPELGDLGLVCGVFIFAHLAHIESNFSLIYGGLFHTIPAVFILRLILRREAGPVVLSGAG